MSEMASEPGAAPGPSGFLSMRNLLIIGGVAVVAYFLFFRNKSTGGTSTGGGGTSTTGDITASPTETVNVQAPTVTQTAPASNTPPGTTPGTPSQPSPNPQPRPPVPPRRKVHSVHYLNYTVKPGDTLASIAKRYHISVSQLAHAPGNVYVAGEGPRSKIGHQLGTGAGLKAGMHLRIPQFT